MTNKATTGVPYISDSGEIAFTISSGTVAFVAGDYFTFSTTASDPYWNVAGSVSGIQSSKAETNLLYNSDDYEVSFIITEGLIPFSAGDTFTFSVAESGLGYGRTVKDIVKKPGTNGNTAVLYAATGRGVYRSINGGQTWTETSNFTGDNVNVLAHHPTLNIIYAGTEDSGVWLSNNNGATWTQYVSGLGRGISASNPVAGLANTGNGIMSKVDVFSAAQSEIWTVTCKTAAQNGGIFSVTGSVSGDQPDYNIASPGPYKVTIGGSDLISFTISDGSTDFAVGDAFTFRTTRDEGRKIKDLLVDDGNDKLYCITNFWGTLEPHAVGNVYSVGIDALSGLPTGDWSEANKGLPQFEPPDDTTLFAQHAMASNVEGAPTALYIGGEGINFYKAAAGLAAGNPDWKVSKTGMTNLIMARMPVLFSGYCYLNIPKVETNGTTITFTVYIQDANGNPPIQGSELVVTQKIGDKKEEIYSLTYPDTYTYIGTWSDPSDPLTNLPITISAENIGQFIFEFTPACTDTAPGCSGSYQKQTY
jgi:hypothetical protein